MLQHYILHFQTKLMDSSLRKHFASWSNYVCSDIACYCFQYNFMKKFAAALFLP